MHPVNAPRILIVASVCMLFVLWQNKKFVGANFKTFVFYFVPTLAVHTIEDKILGESFFAISVMTFGMRVITKAGNVKRLQQLVIEYPRFQNGSGYFNPLSSQAMPDIFIRTLFGN